MTAPTGDSAATASIAATAARPSCREASTSGTGRTDMSASLMVSLATRGSASRRASTGAIVDFPLAGGPETTTNRAVTPAILFGTALGLYDALRFLAAAFLAGAFFD